DTDEAALQPFLTPLCVIFTDLTGFSERPMMESLHRLLRFEQGLSAVLDVAYGQLCKSMGDSFMLLFPTIEDGLSCLAMLQTLLPDIPFSAGVGYGPVLVCRHAAG